MIDLLRRAASSAASLSRFSRSAPENPGVRLARTFERDLLGQRLVLGVHREDRGTPAHVGAVDDDLAVEAARPQQRRIEHVRPVGRGDQDHAGVLIEAVHLDEQLVQRLFALVVAAAEAGAALAADRVDLVDEDDARRRFLGLFEQIADARGADADEHLDEVGTGDREERDAGLAGDRAGQQRLAGSRRPEQQHALGDARAERLELLRVLQELDDLAQLFFGFFDPGDVGEGHLRPVFTLEFRARSAEGERLTPAALGLPQQKEQQQPEQQERHEVEDQLQHRRRGRALGRHLDVVLQHRRNEVAIVRDRRLELVVRVALAELADDVVTRDRHLGDLVALHRAIEVAVGNLRRGLLVLEQAIDHHDQQYDDDDDDEGRFDVLAH